MEAPSVVNGLKHVHTEGQFQGVVSAASNAKDGPGEASRFDSHNILRSDETNDLLRLLDDDGQIWLKRGVISQNNGASVAEEGGSPSNSETEPNDQSTMKSPVSTASISALILTFPSDSFLHTDGHDHDINVVNASTPVGDDDDRSLCEDGMSLNTSQRSQAATDAMSSNKKSLTRRLSSFFSRSFRRKSRAQTKRASYTDSNSAEPPVVHRPASQVSQVISQKSTNDATSSSRQQLLRLGFSLDIDEALRNQADSFVFVSMSESGYFSTNMDHVEKLRNSVVDLRCDLNDNGQPGQLNPIVLPCPVPSSRVMGRAGDGRTSVDSRAPSKFLRPAQRPQSSMPSSATFDSTSSHPVRLSTGHRPHIDHAKLVKSQTSPRPSTTDGPRRLSFMEGTSVMESINHLPYTEEYGCIGSTLSDDNLSHAQPITLPNGQQAKKLKFKKHPWRWIRSKF